MNLAKSKIMSETLRTHCKLGPKDTIHALWSCPMLSTVWQVLFVELLVTATNSCSSFLDVIQLAQQDQTCFALFACTASLIWQRRNNLRLGEDTFPLMKINSIAANSLQEFHQLHPTHSAIPQTARSVKWRLPPEGFLEVNFDGVVFAANNIASLGIIICNDSELVMAALSQQIPLPISVEMVEVGLSMSLSESGLCPTWNRLDGIGF
uniref:RNase H type-1 domain-containing protein n=1 Tax=Quercus lobata TaxID=97700 RepID=A0A7N2LQY5_QUELO